MSIFYYDRSPKDRQWYFRLKANNNEIILSSTEGYVSTRGCLKGIESVRRNATDERNYDRFRGKDKRFYFTLIAGNGERIGKSEAYETKYARDRGMKICRSESSVAIIKKAVKMTGKGPGRKSNVTKGLCK